jgi:hypothetical protein
VSKSPEQEIFDAIYSTCLHLGYRTYDYLPPNGTQYPFVYIGEVFQQDRHTKSGLFGDIQVTVHIFNDRKKRKETTTMRDTIKNELYKLKRAGSINVMLKRGTGQILIDNSTSEPLLHGILELEFTYN